MQNSLPKSFQFISLLLYKNKNKEFWAQASIPRFYFQSIKIILGSSDTYSMRWSTQGSSVLYWRLSDLKWFRLIQGLKPQKWFHLTNYSSLALRTSFFACWWCIFATNCQTASFLTQYTMHRAGVGIIWFKTFSLWGFIYCIATKVS